MERRYRKDKLRNSRTYMLLHGVATYMDRYYLDGILGLIPGGIGDIISGLFSLTYVYFAMFRLKSIPLTMAILNNIMRDIILGLIPFYVGDAIDFFHKSNSRNLYLIDGYLNNDKPIINEINRKATMSTIIAIMFVILIFAMLSLLGWIAKEIGSLLFI